MNTRDKFKRKAILTNTENDWLNFRLTRIKVNIKLRNAKKDYYSLKIAGQKFNPRKAWKSIDSLLGKENKSTVVNELTVGNNNLTCPEDIAEGFNEYFSNIGPELSSKIDSSNLKHISKVLNQSLLHSSLLLSAKSLIFYMDFLAIKPLALIKFLAKLSN